MADRLRRLLLVTPGGLLDSRQPSSTEVSMRLIGLTVILSLAPAPLEIEAQQAIE